MSREAPDNGATTPVWRRILPIVLVALAIRLIVMIFLLPDQFTPDVPPKPPHFHMGFETGRIAYSLVSGRGFGSPLYGESGPTAWMTPVYPLIFAGVFKTFGTYSKASAVVMLSFNALTSALTCIAIFLIGLRSLGAKVAKWAAWGWAFCPYGIYFPLERIWETWLATLILCFLFLITLRMEGEDRVSRWLGFGALWGLGALTSPAILTVLPFLSLWVIYRQRRQGRPWFRVHAIAAIAFIIVVMPWFVRNYRVFHRFIPFRDNLGIVLRLGTKGNSDYWGPYELGPWNSPAEWKEFQEVGELRYMDHKKQQALEFIRTHPRWYAWTTLRRMFFIWTGYWSLDHDYLQVENLDPANIPFCTALTVLALLGLRRVFKDDWLTALPYAIVLFIFPLIYYITSPEFYYRRPMDPFFVILAVAALVPVKKWAGVATDACK
jgi:4-amino-4-deoxy-L-arabinose transferase-like glycosyltransferase